MSKNASYDSEKKINETKQSINDILKSWDNGVYVFDFGHYYHYETKNDDINHYLFKAVIKGSKQYIDTLFPEGKDDTTDYRYFDRSIKEVRNISDGDNEINEKDVSFDFKVKEIVAEEVFDISVWANKLKEHNIGGCLLASSIVAGNHQSAVWVVLNKPIRGLIKGKTYCFMPCEGCPRKNNCSKGFVPLKDDRINTIFSKIDDLLINELVYNSEQRTKTEIYHESTYAAISQVFVRNIQHNHIPNILDNLSKEKQYTSGIKDLYKRNVYTSDIEVELHQSVANFFSYVSNRSKYLNDATFNATYVKREEVRSVYKLFIDFDANRILLNHISNNSNFKYKIVFMHEGNIIKANKDISVSLPAGDLGAQAFYNILENIVSNTAEYGELTADFDVIFTVNFVNHLDNIEHPFLGEGESKYYLVEICDNVPINMDEANFKEEIKGIQLVEYNEYFNVEKDKEKDIDNTSDACAENNKDKKKLIKDAADLLVFKQNTRLNKSIIDNDTHRLRSHYLGLIEMETSAAFLRQEKLPEIESDNYNLKHGQYYNKNGDNYYPYFIQAFKHPLDDNQKEFSLGYRFYMKKPK